MPTPLIPQNFNVQQGNGNVLCSWNLVSGATSYSVQRSIDSINWTQIGTPTVPQYLDTTATVGTQYYYQAASVSASGTSPYCAALCIVPVVTGQMTLGQVRLLAQQRADRVGSNFVTMPEWNTYINQSYFELYDLLTTCYEDYYMAPVYTFITTGTQQFYPLPDGLTVVDYVTQQIAAPFYKLKGVDLGLDASQNAWVTLKKFNFIGRNRYVFPQLTTTFLGVFNLRYRVMGSNIEFIPTPSDNQFLRMWYVPRMAVLLQDSDILDGVSGWTEYVVVDAAIKALIKEEADVTALIAQKMLLKARIEETAMNRDEGEPDTISDTRSWSERWGTYGPPNGDGGWGGW